MSDTPDQAQPEMVQWQETLLHTGTVEDREAAFAAHQKNPAAQHFVFGGPRTDTAQAKDRVIKKVGNGSTVWPVAKTKPTIPMSAKERVDDLNRQMAKSRARLASNEEAARQRRANSGGPRPKQKFPPGTPDPSPVSEAEKALNAFMGHGPR